MDLHRPHGSPPAPCPTFVGWPPPTRRVRARREPAGTGGPRDTTASQGLVATRPGRETRGVSAESDPAVLGGASCGAARRGALRGLRPARLEPCGPGASVSSGGPGPPPAPAKATAGSWSLIEV